MLFEDYLIAVVDGVVEGFIDLALHGDLCVFFVAGDLLHLLEVFAADLVLAQPVFEAGFFGEGLLQEGVGCELFKVHLLLLFLFLLLHFFLLFLLLHLLLFLLLFFLLHLRLLLNRLSDDDRLQLNLLLRHVMTLLHIDILLGSILNLGLLHIFLLSFIRSELILIEWIQQKFFKLLQIKCNLPLSISFSLELQQLFCCIHIFDHEVAPATESFLVEGKDEVEQALNSALGPCEDFLSFADVGHVAEVHSEWGLSWIRLKSRDVGSDPFQIFNVGSINLIFFILHWPSELSLKLILIIRVRLRSLPVAFSLIRRRILRPAIRIIVVPVLVEPAPVAIELVDSFASGNGEARSVL